MGTLYVLSTPIGNLSDLSERAKYILDNIEYVIAEDTRVSKKLFKNNKNNINIISVHKFSPNSKIKQGATSGDGNDKKGKSKSKVDPAIFRMAEQRDY